MSHDAFRPPALSALDDRGLIARHRAGDRHARGVLIERYLPLAHSLALRYRHTSEPHDDLVQVASLGLVKAVDAWDPERGVQLTTFAVPTILGELRRHFRDRTWVVRPPRRLVELAMAAERVREPLGAALGREPRHDDFGAQLGRPTSAVAEALHAARGRWSQSLDVTSSDAADSESFGDVLGADDVDFEQLEARMTFERLTSGLTRQTRELLRLRFVEDLSQSVIAARLGRSQMHVSRALRAALAELAARVEPTRFGYQSSRA
jgi:RNA polymerase sigma-B factor